MKAPAFALWRPLFFLSGVLIAAGGGAHPRGGGLAEMLADPAWVPAHSMFLAGILALLAGLVAYGRAPGLSDRTRRWVRFAIVGTAVEVAELVVHTAAVVDAAHLAAAQPTPVLTTHLWMSIVLYPVFGATVAGLIAATAMDRSLGSRWIAWLGVIGVVAHSVAPALVLVLKVPGAGILFPMILLFALWLLLAALWPVRAPVSGLRPAPLSSTYA